MNCTVVSPCPALQCKPILSCTHPQSALDHFQVDRPYPACERDRTGKFDDLVSFNPALLDNVKDAVAAGKETEIGMLKGMDFLCAGRGRLDSEISFSRGAMPYCRHLPVAP